MRSLRKPSLALDSIICGRMMRRTASSWGTLRNMHVSPMVISLSNNRNSASRLDRGQVLQILRRSAHRKGLHSPPTTLSQKIELILRMIDAGNQVDHVPNLDVARIADVPGLEWHSVKFPTSVTILLPSPALLDLPEKEHSQRKIEQTTNRVLLPLEYFRPNDARPFRDAQRLTK